MSDGVLSPVEDSPRIYDEIEDTEYRMPQNHCRNIVSKRARRSANGKRSKFKEFLLLVCLQRRLTLVGKSRRGT